jgi:Fe-coproporphyrin III synthase
MPAAASIDAARRLPLVTLYLTERCNSRCVTCDYWRNGRRDMNLEGVRRLLPELRQLDTRLALLSGGEPLLNPEWQQIAGLLRDAGIECWLLTSGLSLAKHARRATELFQAITVSLDGTTAATYAAIRGLDAFDKVCAGVRLAVAEGARVSLRVTLQRANYRELPRFIELAAELGVAQVSFLAVDVGNAHAFARVDEVSAGLALGPMDLPVFEALIDEVEREQGARFHSRFIAESPARLRDLSRYFGALLGLNDFPPVRCNAPDFSAVVGVDGHVSPCFFIAGPPGQAGGSSLPARLASPTFVRQRDAIRAGEYMECRRCVCSLHRTPQELAGSRAFLAGGAA